MEPTHRRRVLTIRKRMLIERIEDLENTTDFHGIARIFWTEVPAFRAANVVWECEAAASIGLAYAREPFREQQMAALVRFVCDRWDGAIPEGMSILEGFPNNRLNCVLLLGPRYHHRFFNMGDLHRKTVVAVPIARCEFSGNESPELFEDLIHSRSDIGDWNRRVRPQVWMRIDNPHASQRGAPVSQMHLTDFDFILSKLSFLAKEGGSIQLRNYMGEELRAENIGGELLLQFGDGIACAIRNGVDGAVGRLKAFISGTCQEALD